MLRDDNAALFFSFGKPFSYIQQIRLSQMKGIGYNDGGGGHKQEDPTQHKHTIE